MPAQQKITLQEEQRSINPVTRYLYKYPLQMAILVEGHRRARKDSIPTDSGVGFKEFVLPYKEASILFNVPEHMVRYAFEQLIGRGFLMDVCRKARYYKKKVRRDAKIYRYVDNDFLSNKNLSTEEIELKKSIRERICYAIGMLFLTVDSPIET